MKPTIAVCTIIAKNYLASARTLCQSVRTHNPEVALFVLIVDEIGDYIKPEQEIFQILNISQIEIEEAEQRAFRYDVVEFATSVKPRLLEFLMEEQGFEKALYFDPDILVVNPLDELFSHLDRASIVLTPHTVKDYPNDNKLPNLHTILTHGIYNLGFIGLHRSSEALRFLRWWDDHLKVSCTRDYITAYFVDQKVMDLAPLFFRDVENISSSGSNVAYWNLHEREVQWSENRWICTRDEQKADLTFFHFSAFNPRQNRWLSRDSSRFLLQNHPDLRRLCGLYAQKLLDNGYDQCITWLYPHNYLNNGDLIAYQTRRFYRRLSFRQKKGSKFLAQPFTSKIIFLVNRIFLILQSAEESRISTRRRILNRAAKIMRLR